MAIIKWHPFRDIEDFFEDFSSFRNHTWDLAVDVCEDDNNVYIAMNIPGIDPDRVDIEAENNYLRVAGSREEEKEVEGKQFYRKEIRRGSFERVIALPSGVEIDKAAAEFDNGVLKITLPKIKGKVPSKIKVKRK